MNLLNRDCTWHLGVNLHKKVTNDLEVPGVQAGSRHLYQHLATYNMLHLLSGVNKNKTNEVQLQLLYPLHITFRLMAHIFTTGEEIYAKPKRISLVHSAYIIYYGTFSQPVC